MLLWLWNFLRGFVTVEVTGFSAERFLNLAARRGIYVWDAERTPAGIRMNVSVRAFKLLKGCAKKSKCRVRIARKQGWPFILYRYRKRKILMGGVIFFIISLYALSLFIWRVEVRGQERLTQEDILLFAESRGVRTGAFKYAVNNKRFQHELMEAFPDISWVDVHTKGTRTTITLSEIIPKQPVIDRETPCDIIAVKDGLITGIVTGAGKPLVKMNDVVRQGETLVSGWLELNSDINGVTAAPVHAYAEVWAKRYTSIKFSVPLAYTEKVYTGRVKTRVSAQLLFADGYAVNFPAASIPYENYDKITYRRQPGVSGDYPLPVVFLVTEYAEFNPEPRTRTAEDAGELAERMLTGRILREFDFQADIIDKQVTYTETPNALYVDAVVTTNERIDQAVPLNTGENEHGDTE